MKFEETKEYLYWWPIKVKRPHETNSGQWVTDTFEMQFVAVSQDQAEELAREISELPTDAERIEREHDQIVSACRNWRGVTGDDKQEIPFGFEMLRKVLKAAPWYRAGIYQSYSRSLVAEDARRGN